jgi:hypothetical protein
MENAAEIQAELLGDIRALLQELVDVDTYDQVGSITEPMPSAPRGRRWCWRRAASPEGTDVQPFL